MSSAQGSRGGASAEEAAASAGALDLLLSDAALGSWRRMVPGMSGVRLARGLLAHPTKLVQHGVGLGGELGKIVAGRSTLAPHEKDRRFSDPAWSNNRVLRTVLQAYLASSAAARSALKESDLDWRDAERMQFILDNLIEASAPSNIPPFNPLMWKSIIDSGGKSVVQGIRNFAGDMKSSPRVPSMIDKDAFTVGETVAATPGSVVLRTPMFELIQYTPTTSTVGKIPLLIVPPTINKFYVLDMAPGRSLIEFLVSQGQQVFVMSWRNPSKKERAWGFDAYGQAIVDALDATTSISRSKKAHLTGICSGGILASIVAAHLSHIGQLDRLASFNVGVTVLEGADQGLTEAVVDEKVAETAKASSRRKGYLDGRALAEMFAWLRPSDLIWNYWVNNYLQGKSPAAFDVLFWNADTTRMTAALHADFIDMNVDNALAKPGGVTMLGSPIDLRKVEVDSYVIAGIADHICPWQSCYRTTQLLGGSTKFVLSTSGHIASLVNPPTNKKSSFQSSETNPEDPEKWLEEATKTEGSWWTDYAVWLQQRNAGVKNAPKSLGSKAFPATDSAPGRYVLDT